MVKPLAATALAAGVLAAGLCASRDASAIVHAGDVAPDFHKTDLDGVQHTLFQYRGRVVVLFILGFS